jgi:hypothetical protein
LINDLTKCFINKNVLNNSLKGIDMDKKLSWELEKLDGKKTVLLISDAGTLQENTIDMVEFLVKKRKASGLYVSLNKPYTTIKESLKDRKIDEKLFFIDTMGRTDDKLKRKEDVLIVQNPADLTTIALAIGAFSKEVKGKKFLIIDALSTLLIYNNLETIAKFIQSLSRLSDIEKDILMVFSTAGYKEDSLIPKIIPFFDKVIKINKTG